MQTRSHDTAETTFAELAPAKRRRLNPCPSAAVAFTNRDVTCVVFGFLTLREQARLRRININTSGCATVLERFEALEADTGPWSGPIGQTSPAYKWLDRHKTYFDADIERSPLTPRFALALRFAGITYYSRGIPDTFEDFMLGRVLQIDDRKYKSLMIAEYTPLLRMRELYYPRALPLLSWLFGSNRLGWDEDRKHTTPLNFRTIPLQLVLQTMLADERVDDETIVRTLLDYGNHDDLSYVVVVILLNRTKRRLRERATTVYRRLQTTLTTTKTRTRANDGGYHRSLWQTLESFKQSNAAFGGDGSLWTEIYAEDLNHLTFDAVREEKAWIVDAWELAQLWNHSISSTVVDRGLVDQAVELCTTSPIHESVLVEQRSLLQSYIIIAQTSLHHLSEAIADGLVDAKTILFDHNSVRRPFALVARAVLYGLATSRKRTAASAATMFATLKYVTTVAADGEGSKEGKEGKEGKEESTESKLPFEQKSDSDGDERNGDEDDGENEDDEDEDEDVGQEQTRAAEQKEKKQSATVVLSPARLRRVTAETKQVQEAQQTSAQQKDRHEFFLALILELLTKRNAGDVARSFFDTALLCSDEPAKNRPEQTVRALVDIFYELDEPRRLLTALQTSYASRGRIAGHPCSAAAVYISAVKTQRLATTNSVRWKVMKRIASCFGKMLRDLPDEARSPSFCGMFTLLDDKAASAAAGTTNGAGAGSGSGVMSSPARRKT